MSASEIAITDAQEEEMAIREQDRLPEIEKDKDRNTIRSLPRLVEKAGFRVRRTEAAR
jgi:hypothetical protein